MHRCSTSAIGLGVCSFRCGDFCEAEGVKGYAKAFAEPLFILARKALVNRTYGYLKQVRSYSCVPELGLERIKARDGNKRGAKLRRCNYQGFGYPTEKSVKGSFNQKLLNWAGDTVVYQRQTYAELLA